MLKAVVISNAIEGIEQMFRSNQNISYTLCEVTANFNPDFSGYDILIVPNGSDNIALFKIKEKIHAFLNEGKMLFCFDGWFTSWVPGNQWKMDNACKTIDIRYHIVDDTYHLFDGIDLNHFIFSHGISGWWACGHIESNEKATILLADTWNRPIIVIDEASTKGFMFLTASGPMADMLFGTNDEGQDAWFEIGKFYQNLIQFATKRINKNKILNIQEY